MSLPVIREAKLYKKGKSRSVSCCLCNNRCTIQPGEYGTCRTRQNRAGELVTLVYGNIQALSHNPIEKKPLYHYFPGSRALTIGTFGCNFTCPWCQNWSLSKSQPKPEETVFLSPKEAVIKALTRGDKGVSVSFNEPTLLYEYSLDLFHSAKKSSLYCCYVTNGYMTEEAMKELFKAGLTGLSVNVKGDSHSVRKYCSANVEKVWENIALAKELGIHVEIINLVIPGVNDREEVFQEISIKTKAIDPEMPVHFTRYHPDWQFRNPPTLVATLEKAHRIAHDHGLNFVYIGNVHGHPLENTYCPTCNMLLISRTIFGFQKWHLTRENKCPQCSRKIPITGKFQN
ncbi:MAG: AmmeMemoRadiSam system radical SAM enzyme [Candidatus Hermodarchaeota archaeon]